MLFIIIYWFGVVLQVIIRTPFGISTRARARVERRVSRTDSLILGLLAVASGLLPLLYSFTDWLSFADSRLPAWAGWSGVGVLAVSLLVLWRGHYDLKANWSPSLELYEGHTLITDGIYRFIRHPMYASQLAWALAQPLLIQNWIAGPGSLILVIPFYLLRSRAEEKMMLEKFGEEYRKYQETTGGIFPKHLSSVSLRRATARRNPSR